LSAQTIYENIGLFFKTFKITENKKTIIFLDEITSCPNAITALKFLCEDNEIAVICSDSVLGFNLNQVTSFPVGFTRQETMYPLDFNEFLINTDFDPKHLEKVKNCFQNLTPVPNLLHEILIKQMRRFIAVGGMPRVVVKYIENENLNDV
jgi:predicted AAA+ superfamily ATPase